MFVTKMLGFREIYRIIFSPCDTAFISAGLYHSTKIHKNSLKIYIKPLEVIQCPHALSPSVAAESSVRFGAAGASPSHQSFPGSRCF